MPGVNPPNTDPLPYRMAAWENRLRAQETQQQLVIVNRRGEPLMVTGFIPGSHPPRWGLAILNKKFGQLLAFFGEQEERTGPTVTTGTVSLTFFTKNGVTVLVRLDATGLFVRNAKTGTYQAVSADYEETVTGKQAYSSKTWGPLPTNIVVTDVPVGPSGAVSATMSVGYLAPGSFSSGESAWLGVAVDGAASPSGDLLIYSVGKTDGLGSSITYETKITGLTPGTHNFSTLAKVSTAGVAATYGGVTLTIVPL